MTLSRRSLLGQLGAFGLLGCRPSPQVSSTLTHAKPIRPTPGFQAGMSLAHIHRKGRGYGSETSREQLRHLRSLGITHVSLTPFGYMRNLSEPTLAFGSEIDRSLTDAHLLQEAANAAAEGIAVCLKPHIWSGAFFWGRSRQDIALGDRWGEWFDAYGAFAEHYAALAQKMDAALYVVGLEYLKATEENPGAWADVATRCRKVYGGPMTYAANWWREVEVFADWKAFDSIGVNAYYPLSEEDDPSFERLVAGWEPHLKVLEALSKKEGLPVLFTEAGFRAVRGAAREPWNQGLKGSFDPDLQARAYEALLAACMPNDWFKGVYWWKWFTDRDGESDLYVPTGQPAEHVLQRWFSMK